MNSQINPSDPRSSGFSPNDDDLIAYLLGTHPVDVREAIESWLAADSSHGERLVELSTTILLVSETAADWPIDKFEEVTSLAAVGARSRIRRFAVLLTLAASITFVLFSILDNRTKSSADSRIAMAWAESLPTSYESETESDNSSWLFDPVAQLETTNVSVTDDLSATELLDSSAMLGFASEEPPEWLLAAVLEMQAYDLETDPSEVTR